MGAITTRLRSASRPSRTAPSRGDSDRADSSDSGILRGVPNRIEARERREGHLGGGRCRTAVGRPAPDAPASTWPRVTYLGPVPAHNTRNPGQTSPRDGMTGGHAMCHEA